MFTESSRFAPRRLVASRRALAGVVALLVVAAGVAGYLVIREPELPQDAAFAVGDDVVDADEVEVRMKALQALYGVKRPTEAEELASFRKDTAKTMALEILLRREAADAGITVPTKRVQDSLNALVDQRYPDGGRAAFVQALGDLGASEQQVLEEIEQQMLVALLFDHVTRDVEVSDADVREAFDERRDELGKPEHRALRNIVVTTRSDAGRVLAALRAGAPFAQVVARSSLDASTRDKGGRLGTVAASDLAPGYSSVAFDSDVGEPFGPVKTRYGWNVGMVETVVPARPATYDKVVEQLRTVLLGERAFLVWTDWLRGVISDADVVYAGEFRPADQNAVPEMGAPTAAPSIP
jgi:peptidyl-prolyl cis-trans isomerase C